ncbi:BAG family molecular chaperone regulator 2 [Rhynchospora pubera]|uniref:BAG family molecular chaperone regulator 2 n=1 Tax=Rhynchospora pubera TaxID=906938 RepID=A0AAV8EWJ7_9POAL|nr:BAG family molecular chaperone regulator 2 [Rhynchospora pubera]
MMRTKAKNTTSPVNGGEKFSPMKESSPRAGATEKEVWEVRPGGMLVQKRTPDSDAPAGPPVPAIRVKVKYAGLYHEVYISSQASFGELKKLLSERTGLHPEDQKLVFKEKERDSKAFLDISGVKDRSKMVLLEDPTAQAKRLIEQCRTGKLEKAAKSISRISLDVDKLATKVTALENIVNKGGKVVEADVVTLTETLMNELIKLDAIAVDGDVKEQKKLQEKRIQKYVESLDAVRLKNATPKANGHAPKPLQPQSPQVRSPQVHSPQAQSPQAQSPQVQSPQVRAQQQRREFQPATAVMTNWEPFDLLSSMPSTSSSTITTTMASSTTSHTAVPVAPRFDWELF